MSKKELEIIKDGENPESDTVIAKAIIEISSAIKRLLAGPITKDALVILIRENCQRIGPKWQRAKPTKKTIAAVLDSIESLKERYVK